MRSKKRIVKTALMRPNVEHRGLNNYCNSLHLFLSDHSVHSLLKQKKKRDLMFTFLCVSKFQCMEYNAYFRRSCAGFCGFYIVNTHDSNVYGKHTDNDRFISIRFRFDFFSLLFTFYHSHKLAFWLYFFHSRHFVWNFNWFGQNLAIKRMEIENLRNEIKPFIFFIFSFQIDLCIK